MIVCPYCGQDYVWEVTIRGIPSHLYMCFECDTVWVDSQDVKDGKGKNFEDFMTQQGRAADWKAIAKVRQINS